MKSTDYYKFYDELGRRLVDAREDADMKQKDAARSIGVSPSALSYYESGQREVGAYMLVKLAQLYEVTPASLLSGLYVNDCNVCVQKTGHQCVSGNGAAAAAARNHVYRD